MRNFIPEMYTTESILQTSYFKLIIPGIKTRTQFI